MEHLSGEVGTLDKNHVSKVMGYVFETWKSPVDLKTIDDAGEVIHYTFDELGFSG